MATTTRRVRVTTPPPHSPGQHELIDYPGSVCLLGGGRYGKTEAGVRRVNKGLIKNPGVYFWIGLARPSASYQKAWRMLRHQWSEAFREADIDSRRFINKSRHDIEVPSIQALLMMRTAENPESIAGDGPKGVVGDEFPYWDQEVWTRFVQPALADHDAWAFMMGRPHGENWAMQLWRDAAQRPGWIQRRYTIYDNPLLNREFIEDLKAHTPATVWAQEYMAEPSSGDDGIIPLDFVLAANERWREREKAGTLTEGDYVLGVDVSEGGAGADLTTFAHRHGWTIASLEDATPKSRGDMMPIADRAAALLAEHGGYAIVDSVGVGAMLPGALRRSGCKVVGFKASAGTKLRDATGQFGFVNLRAAAWWHLRELLSPDGPGVALPPDRDLVAELTAPTFDVAAGAKVRLEAKDRIKKRLGRSPDKADAVVQAFWDRTILKPRGR